MLREDDASVGDHESPISNPTFDSITATPTDTKSNNPFRRDTDISTENSVHIEKESTNDQHLESRYYTNLESSLFKTSNRIIDDIKADLLFLLGENETLKSGILKERPLTYSHTLSSQKHIPYDIYIFNQSSPFVSPVEHKHSKFNHSDKITIIRALLFNHSEPTLSRSEVYHIRIVIKEKDYATAKSVAKNEYHLVENLNSQDSHDLIEAFSVENIDDVNVNAALPKIIDEANYVCSLTNKIFRIEISEPEFDQDDLHDFEIGPINVRYNKALQVYPDLNEEIPSPAQCLHTLFKAIKGPLLLKPTDEQKTINASNSSLNSHINPQILFKRLFFQTDEVELQPPNVSDPTDRAAAIVRESYVRKILEVILLGTKAYSANKVNPFNIFEFTKSLNLIFDSLQDNGSIRWVNQHQYLKEEAYINLSAYPFYSDDLITTCFQKTTDLDKENIPIYFDSLKEVSRRQSNYKLSSYVSKLISLGMVGKKEIDDAYKGLGIDPLQAPYIDDNLLLTMYKNEISEHPLDGKIRTFLKTIATARKSAKIERYLLYEPIPLQQAYDTLDIDSTVDDDVVSTAVMIRKNDSPNESQLFTRAYITIASERKSFELLDQIEREFPDIYEPISFKEACEYLGVDETADEFQTITIFQAGDREIKNARNALRVIGQQKNSKVIESFLRTGLIDHTLLPAEDWPVGLNNIGNTCYLNSLLQYYFSIKPLRDAILQFNEVYGGEEIYHNRRIGGRLVGEAEIERSFQFTYHLRDLFFEQIHSDKRCITPSKELAYLAFLPSFTEVEFEKPGLKIEPEIINIDDDDDVINDNEAIDSIHLGPAPEYDQGEKIQLFDLVEVTSNTPEVDTPTEDLIDLSQQDEDGDVVVIDRDDAMQLDTSPVKPERPNEIVVSENETPLSNSNVIEKTASVAKIRETEMETAYEIGRQQDVTECIGNVLSQVEAAFKPEGFDEYDNEQNDLIKHLFFGQTVQHLIDVNDPSIKRDKTDRFSNLFVNISDQPRNLYEAFDIVFKTEEVQIDSGNFKRSERITKLPIILQIQIQRVYFDRVALRPYKSIEPLPFPQTLYMDRYLDTDNAELIKRRDEVEKWKLEIADLKARKEKILAKNEQGISLKDSLRATKEWLQVNQLAKAETIQVLENQIKSLDDELLEIYQTVNQLEHKVDHNFDLFQKEGYSIFAIFIHRGEANYGHYWIYIKDEKRRLFRKYNDEIVSEVPASEVFNFDEGNTATPYFLGYIKNGHEDDIEPLLRKNFAVQD